MYISKCVCSGVGGRCVGVGVGVGGRCVCVGVR